MMQKANTLNPRAIVIGFAADMFLTQLFVLALMIILFDPGTSPECLAQRIDFRLLDLLGLAWGLFFTVLGGFVSARLARAHHYQHALHTGFLSVLASLSINGQPEDALYLLGLVLTIPAALLGARIAKFWS